MKNTTKTEGARCPACNRAWQLHSHAEVGALQAEVKSLRARDEYNGWTNYQTWVTKLWIDNDESSQQHWADQAKDVLVNFEPEPGNYTATVYRHRQRVWELATRLKDDHEGWTSHGAFEAKLVGVLSDLLGHAIERVNFREIAASLIEDATELLEEDE